MFYIWVGKEASRSSTTTKLSKSRKEVAYDTCMLPIKNANRTKPKMHKTMQNIVSPRYVVVSKVCPYELHRGRYQHTLQGMLNKIIYYLVLYEMQG